MLKGYQRWALVRDKGTHFLAMETAWDKVYLRDPQNPSGRGIPLAGRFDALVQRHDGLWVLDFKTTKYQTNDWTMQDLQATTYVYAARQLYGPTVRGLLFRFLLKKAPYTYEQLILKNGSVTRRSNLERLTTYEEYVRALAIATLYDLARQEEFAQQIMNTLSSQNSRDSRDSQNPRDSDTLRGETRRNHPTLQDCAALLDLPLEKRRSASWHPVFMKAYKFARREYHGEIESLKGQNSFFWEVPEYRTEKEVAQYVKYVLYPAAREMRSLRKNKWIGPTGLGAAYAVCSNCSFREPCRLVMRGADCGMVLREDYVRSEDGR